MIDTFSGFFLSAPFAFVDFSIVSGLVLLVSILLLRSLFRK